MRRRRGVELFLMLVLCAAVAAWYALTIGSGQETRWTKQPVEDSK